MTTLSVSCSAKTRSIDGCADDLAIDAPLLKARDLDSALNTTHHSSLKGVTPNIYPEQLFSYNPTCVLGPDVTQGPYCIYPYSWEAFA